MPDGCFYCGNGAGADPRNLVGGIHTARIPALGGLWGWVCDDPIACARRQNAAKQLRLFGDPS